jgi:hypothetical protein
LKPAQTNSSLAPISKRKKKNHKKRAGGVAQGVGPEFKPSTTTTTKKWRPPGQGLYQLYSSPSLPCVLREELAEAVAWGPGTPTFPGKVSSGQSKVQGGLSEMTPARLGMRTPLLSSSSTPHLFVALGFELRVLCLQSSSTA